MIMQSEHVEDWVKTMGEQPVPREYINAALGQIETHQVEVRMYPSGEPSVRAVYELATKLESADATKN